MPISPTYDLSAFVHSPADLAVEAVEYYQRIMSGGGIRWGIPMIDEVVSPLLPEDVAGILGRPGSGKTTLLLNRLWVTAESIRAENLPHDPRCVVLVTWETSPEGMAAALFGAMNAAGRSSTEFYRGEVDMDTVTEWANRLASLPLWIIGTGVSRGGTHLPPLTPGIVFKVLGTMEQTWDSHPHPVLLGYDYLQMVPPDERGQKRNEQVEAAMRGVKDLTVRMGCPAWLAIQASREVDDMKIKCPTEAHGYYSAVIEQVLDYGYGIWRMSKTEPPGSIVEFGGHRIQMTAETSDLFALMLWKQKKGRGDRHEWLLTFRPQFLRLAELELRRAEEEEGTLPPRGRTYRGVPRYDMNGDGETD